MREKTNQVESFWREIGNWCRSVFIRVDLSALKINIKQQCWNEKENPKDKISCLPLTNFSNHEINLVYLLNKESVLRKLLLNKSNKKSSE